MIELLKHYLETRMRVLGLRAQYYTTVLMAVLAHLALVALPLLVGLLLLGISLGLGLGQWWGGRYWLGMLVVSLLFITLGIIMYICRDFVVNRLQQLVDRKILEHLEREGHAKHERTPDGNGTPE